MTEHPTAGDFFRSAWAWFKRNLTNILLVIIILQLWFIAANVHESSTKLHFIESDTETWLPAIMEKTESIDNTLQSIEENGINRGVDAYIEDNL
jgi:hypothetical protein